MTREEAKQEFNNYGYIINEQNNIVDKIYDNFENRNCYSCKHCPKVLSDMSPFCNIHNFWLTEESSKILFCNKYETRRINDIG